MTFRSPDHSINSYICFHQKSRVADLRISHAKISSQNGDQTTIFLNLYQIVSNVLKLKH